MRFKIFLVLIFIHLSLVAQVKKYFDASTKFGIIGNGFYSGSGMGALVGLDALLDKHTNGIEFGLLLQTLPKTRVAGFNGTYKYYLHLMNTSSVEGNNNVAVPYIMYSFLYQNSFIPVVEVYYRKDVGRQEAIDSYKVVNYESYIGGGIRFDLTELFRFEMSCGYGGYLSTDNLSNYRQILGPHKKASGLTAIFRLGLGYKIN